MQKTAENVEKVADCGTLSRQRELRGHSTETAQISAVAPAARHAKPSEARSALIPSIEGLSSASPAVPASSHACDIIIGGKAIAQWLGLTYEQVRPLIDDRTIPTFKLPGHTKRCALKSTLNETFRQYANRRPIANAPAEEKSRA